MSAVPPIDERTTVSQRPILCPRWEAVNRRLHRAPDLASVGMDGLPDKGPGGLRGQEDNRPRDVVRRPDPARGDVLGVVAVHILQGDTGFVCVDMELRRV